jgi:hypothetical protein
MATKYSDIVKLREQKAAYNIQNEQDGDWKSFIANDQFNDILRKVIGSVRNNDADLHKSFWISGTYGTGKSHAGAVIKHLLCDPIDSIADYINEEYIDAKYEMLRTDLFKLRESKRLFPVMLYGQCAIVHKEDLSLQLQRRIIEALNGAGIEISVKTDFDNYIRDIQQDPEFWDLLIGKSPLLKSITPTRQKLINDLKSGDTATLKRVRDALRENGKSINLPLTDISQWFFEVQRQLAETTEYDGLLVIWDEFTDVMTSDLGLSLLIALQEIDERIMNSENNSYFFYISHPSALNSLNNAEREKTKGRYHYMGYNMEPVSAFKIMSRKFLPTDKDAYDDISQRFYEEQDDLLDIFAKSSTNVEETKSDLRKLFPLHPSTANLATYYAREAGSSSRSVFQFIGENPAIRDFLDNSEYFTDHDTITADYLWDYVVGEFNENVAKFGAVTERFNSRKLQVEEQGADYFAVFKSILLLNALNNIANNETVTPSEQNIKNLFAGTSIEEKLDTILNWFDEHSIIQRLSGLFSIQFSALPTKEIESLKEELRLTQYKFTSQIINTGDTAKKEFGTFLSQVARANQFLFYSENTNEYTLLSQIERGYKDAKPYEVFMALLLARNAAELNNLKEIAYKASAEERFQNIVFIVFESVLGDKNYERFIEIQANATCANKHSLPDQYQAHAKSASEMIKEWMQNIRRGNFTYYLRGQSDINATTKIASTINACVSPAIFEHGAESLEIIKTKFSKTYWQKLSAKQIVDSILSYNTKDDILKKCGGASMHVNYLLQDSVDENLQWQSNVDKTHPLYLVSEFIDKKFKHTDKNQQFNLADKLIDLTKPPYGLYQSYAGMGMVAFAMRKYTGQIFDPNGKPRSAQHLVDDIVEMFKVWEAEKTSNKLNFRFETKESRHLCENLIKQFKLNALKGYNDISSLTDARWVITHNFSEERGFPLWSLKYTEGSSSSDDFQALVDNILAICGDFDMRNPDLINKTLSSLEKYRFELGNILNSADSFKIGFTNYLKSINNVGLQDNEVEEANEYLKKHLQETIGLWTESEVSEKLTHWRLNKLKEEKEEQQRKQEEILRNQEKNEGLKAGGVDSSLYARKRRVASNKIKQIQSVSVAQRLLEDICDLGNETVLDIINNSNV